MPNARPLHLVVPRSHLHLYLSARLGSRRRGRWERCHLRISLRHLLPNAAGPLLVQVTFGVPAAILAEASLSFLGLGAPPGTPSWGALIDQGAQYLLVAPHVALFPGLLLLVTVLGLNLLGDALRDALAPGQG